MEKSTLRNQLFACLKVEWAATTATELAQLSVTDWEELVMLAWEHGVFPVLWQRLQSYGQLVHVPATLAQRMEAWVNAATSRNLRLYHELGVILTSLRQHQIEVIVLKGAHLAATVYPHPSLRYMNDLDLLFHPADLLAAAAVLQALGYHPPAPIDWTHELDIAYHLPGFSKPGVVARVEIHWMITHPNQPYTITIEELWKRATPVTLAGVETLGLCPEDLLLHICEHASYHHHFSQRMRFLCDIDALVRHYCSVIDWRQVQARAQAYQWAKGVHLTLLLAKQLLATPVPQSVLQDLQAAEFDVWLATSEIDQFFADQTSASRISTDFAHFSVAQTWSEKAKIVQRRLLLPRHIIAHHYHVPMYSPKLWFYYLVHYKNLLIRYGGHVWRLWRKDQALLDVVDRNLVLNHRKVAIQEWIEKA